jgi:hypothetical protein
MATGTKSYSPDAVEKCHLRQHGRQFDTRGHTASTVPRNKKEAQVIICKQLAITPLISTAKLTAMLAAKLVVRSTPALFGVLE